jgi:ABC-2 type transport system permease protein
MAGLKPAETAAAGGMLGALARRQYAALALLRWQMLRNSLRSGRGALELGARALGLLLHFALGVMGAFGFGIVAYFMASHQAWTGLPVELWVLLALWQALPVLLASQQERFGLDALLRFPVSFGSFFLLHLVFGLVDASSILFGLCSVGIWLGIVAAWPSAALGAALALGGFAAFNVLLARAILVWLDRWLAQRRTREIVSALFLVFLLGLQLLNPILQQSRKGGALSSAVRAVSQHRLAAVQAWSPPGLAARALQQAAEARPLPALECIGALGLYALFAGGLLAVRLRAEHRGENLGEAPPRLKPGRRQGGWRLNGSGPIAAVMEKELHTLARSLPLLYGLASPLIMVFILGGVFRNGPMARTASPLGLAFCLNIALLGFVPLIYNSLGAEGTGIQIYFLAPTPIRTMLAAKNLLHALLFGLDAVLVVVLAGLRFGWPDAVVLLATLAWLPFALLIHLALGNILSLSMPHRMNLSRVGRQSGSQLSGVLSVLVQAAMLGLGVMVFGLCKLEGVPWLTVPAFLTLAAAALFFWRRVLRNVDRMANQRRDVLIATLAKVE